MTTKDFKIKRDYYIPLNSCVDLIQSEKYVYHVDLVNLDGTKSSYYSQSKVIVPIVKSCLVQLFDKDDFLREIAFFRSFVSKCTLYQRLVLLHDSNLKNLMKYCGYVN